MKFGYTIIYVQNVTTTIEFYEKAFGFARKFITPENDYGELLTGETTLSFASRELGKSNIDQSFTQSSLSSKPFEIELAFVTENIVEDFETAITAGAVLVREVVEKPWGQRVGYLRDVNGFLIEICTPVKK